MLRILILVFLCLGCSQKLLADHASATFQTGSAGAIVTSSGSTLPQGKWVVGSGVQFIELDDVSDATLEAAGAAEEDVHSVDNLLQVNVNGAYGLTDDLTLGFFLPYVDRSNVREAEHEGGGGEVELAGDSKGLGDLSLFAQYRFFKQPGQNAAVMFGIKTPTGESDERELEGGLFEVEQQPGSGSWDPFLGLSYDRAFEKLGLSASVLYTFVTEGDQQTNLGNIFNYNVASTYRLFSPEGGHSHESHAHGFSIVDYVDVVLELNGDYRDRVEINSANDDNTGGHTLYLSPGIRAGLAHRVSLFASVGVPIINDLNGIQSEPEVRVIGGMSVLF